MASVCLSHFISWGWLRQDYDETLNSYVVSFPEYSQLFMELFQKLYSEEDLRERESVLAVYSYLYTYRSDPEKNNEILKSAWKTSIRLSQMLSNMQEGMRSYFDELSGQRDFRGIQEVLIKEINNSDSRKYAILTTTDSFYRYKEAVKELIDQNLTDNEQDLQKLEREMGTLEVETPAFYRKERAIQLCEEAADLIYRIGREFDAIEQRYNRLIEQKTIFASRAAARIRYLLQEGNEDEDQTLALVQILGNSRKREEILTELQKKMHLTTPYHVLGEKSLFSRREQEKSVFRPEKVAEQEPAREELDAFVLKPLYTRAQIDDFRKKHMKNGVFEATARTVQSMEDLEKLFFVWQEATELADSTQTIEIGEELTTEDGLTYSRLTIKE
jgi:hypothetical protein